MMNAHKGLIGYMRLTFSDAISWTALAQLALWLTFSACSVPAVAQFGQAGCATAPCVNPVPCENCSGTWTDDYGAIWGVTSEQAVTWGTWSVTGNVSVPHPITGCPRINYTVSGSVTQTWGSDTAYGATSFTWQASNPSPSTICSGVTPFTSVTYNGSIENNGCNKGNGTWMNSSGGSGSFTMSKPPEVPSGELTTSVGWSSGYGGSVHQWRQVLQGPFLAGRQVAESPTGGDLDTCNWPDSGVDNFRVTGGYWNVGFFFWDNTWGDDYIGWTGARVTYYRTNMRPPCSASAGQGMNIAIQGRSGALHNYLVGSIGTGLPDSVTVTSSRAGQTVSTTWP